MYKNHVPKIAQLGKSDISGFLAIVRFSLHTIRRRFYGVDINNKLMKSQENAWQEICSNQSEYYRFNTSDKYSLEQKLINLSKPNGLGIAKAGFVLQMLGQPVGCIDSHNLNKLNHKSGIRIEKFWLKKSNLTAYYNSNKSKVRTYIGLCYSKELISPEHMWDNWCGYIAHNYPKKFSDDYHVSEFHLQKIKEFKESIENGHF